MSDLVALPSYPRPCPQAIMSSTVMNIRYLGAWLYRCIPNAQLAPHTGHYRTTLTSLHGTLVGCPADDDSGYRVYAPKPSPIQQIRGGSWGWDEEEVDSSRPPVPEWNPRTGFMGTPTDQGGASSSGSSGSGSGGGGAAASRVEEPEVQASFLTPSAVAPEGALPVVSKGQVRKEGRGKGR